MINERCHQCRYYQPHYENQGPLEIERPLPEGSCRRFPPVSTHHPIGRAVSVIDFAFPVVGAAEWCGEFDRKREERDDD